MTNNFSKLLNELYDAALPLYQSDQRVFHNEVHLSTGFYILQRLLSEGEDIQDVHFAAWCFHDAVYEIGASDNEEMSALFFEQMNKTAGFGFDKNEVDMIKTIILDTKTHTPSIEESKIVLDVDMFILGSKYDDFVLYREQIREEYSAQYSNEEIKEGTKLFLDDLLTKKSPIFHSEQFFKYEEQAKENARRYLAEKLND